MAIETLKESLSVNQIIGKSKENIVIEDDVIIPDIKPDILSTINVSGNVCVYKKEIMDGKIRIDGGIQVYIIYLADDEKSVIRGINTVLDFSRIIEMEKVNSSEIMESKIELKDIGCKIINGRKISINANIDAIFTIYSNENIDFVKEVANADNIQIQNAKESMDLLVGIGNTKVYAKDTINISNTDNLVEILKNNITILNSELKTSYNKILIKADANINLMYLTDDNRINEVNCKIPIMGFIDMQNVTDENLCNTSFEIKNIIIKPNSMEEHSIFIEIEIEINCNVYEKKSFENIQDLYSPTQNLNLKQKSITVMEVKREVSEQISINEKINTNELQGEKICNLEILPKVLEEKLLCDRVNIEGELELIVLYISTINNRLDSKHYKVPFKAIINTPGITKDFDISTYLEVLNKQIQLKQDESIEFTIDLKVNCNLFKMKEIKVIDDIETLDNTNENIYSIVVYFVKPGDTLWNIAKKFKSTIKAISTVNGIEDENNIDVGQQLFIPKFI